MKKDRIEIMKFMELIYLYVVVNFIPKVQLLEKYEKRWAVDSL